MTPSVSSQQQPRRSSQLRGLVWSCLAGIVVFTIAVANEVRIWIAAGCALAFVAGCCLVHYRELRGSFRRQKIGDTRSR